MQIIPLSEGRFTIDATKIFVPFDPAADILSDRPAGSLLVEIQPFLVITAEDRILLDTGLGFRGESGRLQIHETLLRNGIEPSSITKVLMSHLHKDHAGGMMDHNMPAFENAVYYVNRNEWDLALQKGFPSYNTSHFEKLHLFRDVIFFEGDGMIGDCIHFETSGGHCPFHTVFTITDGGETVFFGGDVAPQLQQMKTRFITKYDSDPRKSMELRMQWWKQGMEKNWTMLFYHDISNPFVRL